ncbi:hypothetical protein ACLEJQ_22335 [Pseudomonas sp. SMV71]|uniref:hypothetical protein n=1 Tax=Pseudomonas sp. SMV71 TaxID=3390195 RepID=UPI003F86C4BE
MKHNFKPGDLAIIVGCRINPEDIGKLVELSERVLLNGYFTTPSGWRVFSASPGTCWVVLSENIASYGGDHGWALVDEKHLMPLRGDFTPEQQKSKEAEPCA